MAIASIEPLGADHHQHHVTGRDLLCQHLHEVETGCDVVHVHEELVRLVGLPQPIQEATRRVSTVVAPVTDEDATRHSHGPHRQSRKYPAREYPPGHGSRKARWGREGCCTNPWNCARWPDSRGERGGAPSYPELRDRGVRPSQPRGRTFWRAPGEPPARVRPFRRAGARRLADCPWLR